MKPYFCHNLGMDYCFDTSGINRLHDDPCRQEIIVDLLTASHVLISELNIIEVLTTKSVERRLSLLRLQGQLTRGVMPLLTPTVLLRNLTTALIRGAPTEAITSGRDNPDAWLALQRPEDFLDEDSRQAAYVEKQNIENRFSDAHRRARTELPQFFPPGERPKSLGQTIRFFCKNPLSFFPTVAVLYEEITKTSLTVDAMRDLFSDLPEWPLFLAGWAQGLYARALQEQNYSARTNPGTIDLWFALYLEHCDFLVTDDYGQYKALRVIKALATRRHPKAKVLLYDQFRARLVLDARGSKN
jgi:hypothetical protein